MIGIHRLRFVLRTTEEVRLHAHHAGLVYALLAQAYGSAAASEPTIPDGLMLDAPEQCRIRLAAGEDYAFGCTLLAASAPEVRLRLDRLRRGLQSLGQARPARSAVLGGNFQLTAVEDLVARRALAEHELPSPIAAEHFEDEIARAAGAASLTIRCTSPLRASRPKDRREAGHAFFDEQYFDARVLMQRLHSRVASLGLASIGDLPELAGAESIEVVERALVWLDVAYGPQRREKSLGGVLGRVVLRLGDPRLARLCVLGQYAGVGESTRFGFGRYRIEELGDDPFACPRAAGLLELALASPVLDRAVADYDLPSGRMQNLIEQVRTGTYRPSPPHQVEIAKAGDRLRKLAIPAAEDRALQRAVIGILAPALDLFFEESSFAYRSGLGRHRAARRLREAYRDGFRWALRADFHHFFDCVDHGELHTRLDAYVADPPTVALLMQWVQNGSPEPRRGLPTGAPISPLLSNLLLDRFDEQLTAEDMRLVRYADDFLLLFRDEDRAARVYQSAADAAARLQLTLNERKLDWLDLTEPFRFLGFEFYRDGDWQCGGDGQPQHMDDLGWRDLSAMTNRQQALIHLSGESPAAPQVATSTAILGPGISQLSCEGEQLVYGTEGGTVATGVQVDDLDCVVVLDVPSIHASLLRQLRHANVSLVLTDRTGRTATTIEHHPPTAHPELVVGQVQAACDLDRRLALARSIIASKIHNAAVLAVTDQNHSRGKELHDQLVEAADHAVNAVSIEELLGVEGAAAAAGFRAFSSRLGNGFHFERRVAPCADDPVNVLLNIAQTALYRHVRLLLHAAGFVSTVGFIHRPRGAHASLASDVQEVFRHLMERTVIEATWRLRPCDFRRVANGPFSLEIAPAAARLFYALIHNTLQIACRDSEGQEAISYQQHIARTIRSLRNHLLDPRTPLRLFRHPATEPQPKGAE